MKIFIDTADTSEIIKYWDAGIIDGVTTNPSLASKVNKPFKEVVTEILSIVNGPISLEVLSTEYEDILREARSLALLNANVVVKIPFIEDGIKAVKVLSREGIKTNVTLVFQPAQAILAAKVGATYVSPFIGRLNDIGQDGFLMLEEIVEIYNNYNFKTEVLAASIRSVRDVVNAAQIGSDIITIPPEILGKMYKHPLTDSGLAKFLEDYKNSNFEPIV